MNRYATIATVWLLPPLLCAAELRYHRDWFDPPYPWPYAFAFIALASSLAGAAIAFAKSDVVANSSRLRRLCVGIVILIPIAATFAALATVFLPRPPALALAIAFIAFFGWFASMPLWSTYLLWRPNIRLASVRFTGIVFACSLPFLLIAGTRTTAITEGHSISSNGGASF